MARVGAVITNPLPDGMELPDIARLARLAESAGLDGVWAEDGIASGDAAVLDITCVLAAAAAATERIEVGSSIFAPSLRNLTWALKQVATLQLIAGGRLQLGVALGAAGEEGAAAVGRRDLLGRPSPCGAFRGRLAVRPSDPLRVPRVLEPFAPNWQTRKGVPAH